MNTVEIDGLELDDIAVLHEVAHEYAGDTNPTRAIHFKQAAEYLGLHYFENKDSLVIKGYKK